jgi:hypothetical protein
MTMTTTTMTTTTMTMTMTTTTKRERERRRSRSTGISSAEIVYPSGEHLMAVTYTPFEKTKQSRSRRKRDREKREREREIDRNRTHTNTHTHKVCVLCCDSKLCKKQKTPNGIDDDSEDDPLPMPIVAVFMVDFVYFCALMFLLRLLCLLPIK